MPEQQKTQELTDDELTALAVQGELRDQFDNLTTSELRRSIRILERIKSIEQPGNVRERAASRLEKLEQEDAVHMLAPPAPAPAPEKVKNTLVDEGARRMEKETGGGFPGIFAISEKGRKESEARAMKNQAKVMEATSNIPRQLGSLVRSPSAMLDSMLSGQLAEELGWDPTGGIPTEWETARAQAMVSGTTPWEDEVVWDALMRGDKIKGMTREEHAALTKRVNDRIYADGERRREKVKQAFMFAGNLLRPEYPGMGSVESAQAKYTAMMVVKNIAKSWVSDVGRFLEDAEGMVYEDPVAGTMTGIDLATIGLSATKARYLFNVGKASSMDEVYEGIARVAKDPDLGPQAVQALDTTATRVQEASGQLAKARRTEEADRARDIQRRLEDLSDEAAENSGRTVQDKLDDIREKELAGKEVHTAPAPGKDGKSFAQLKKDLQAARKKRDEKLKKIKQAVESEDAEAMRALGAEIPEEVAAGAGLRKLSAEAGEVKTELLARLSASAVGGGIGGVLGARDDDTTFSIPGAIVGIGTGMVTTRFFSDPRFRNAVFNATSVGLGRGGRAFRRGTESVVEKFGGKRAPTEITDLIDDAGNWEEVIRAYFEPLLPDRLIGLEEFARPAAIGSRIVGGTAGGLLGGTAGEGEFSPARAGLGAAVGVALAGRASSGFAELFRGGLNPRKTFMRLVAQDRGLPPAVAQIRRQMMRLRDGRLAEIMDVTDTIAKKTRGNQALANKVDEFIRGDVGALAIEDEVLRAAATDARYLYDEMALDLIQVGLATGRMATVLRSNIGRYSPRLYLHHERGNALLKAQAHLRSSGQDLSRLSKAQLDGLRRRKDLPRDVREALGEISAEFDQANPAYLLGKRGAITNSDIFTAHYANQIASSVDWTLPQSLVKALDADDLGEAARLLGAERAQGVGKSVQAGRNVIELDGKRYLKMPDNKKLGALRNRYVEENIALDFEVMIETPSALMKWLDAGTAFFKSAKVTLNPATLARNLYGNTIMADMGGLSPARLDVYRRGFTEYVKKGPEYLEARRAGLFAGQWRGAEVQDLLTAMNSSKEARTAMGVFEAIDRKMLRGSLDKLGKFHDASEKAWKMTMYSFARRELGMSVDDAVRYSHKYIFNYNDVPRWVQITRRSILGAPFISFSYKSLPRIFENAFAVGSPGKALRFWKYPLAMGAVNEVSARENGFQVDKGPWQTFKRVLASGLGFTTEGDFGQMKRMLPDYSGDQQVLVPKLRDRFGRPQWFDGTWTLPWGDLGEFGKGFIGKQFSKMGFDYWPRQIEPSNPWLQTGIAFLTGKDLFTGKEVVPEYTDAADASLMWMRYIARSFTPALTPGVGFSAEKLRKSIQQEMTGKLGDPDIPSLPVAIASEIFGIKLRPLDPQQAFTFKALDLKKRIEDGQKQIMRLGFQAPRGTEQQLGQFIQGNIPLSKVPKNARGLARKIKRKIELMEKDAKKFNEEYGTAEDLPEAPAVLTKARQR